MKLLSLNMFENEPYECVYDVKHLFLGDDTAPEVQDACDILQARFSLKDEDGLYVETWWDDNLFEEMVDFLGTIGYTLFEPTNIVLAYQG